MWNEALYSHKLNTTPRGFEPGPSSSRPSERWEDTCSFVPLKKISIFPCFPKSKSSFSMFPVPQNCLCSLQFILLYPWNKRPYSRSPKPLDGPHHRKYFNYASDRITRVINVLITLIEVIFTRSFVPLKKKWVYSLVPQNQNLHFLCSLFSKIAFVSLFPSVLYFCSPEINGLIPFPKTLGRASSLEVL